MSAIAAASHSATSVMLCVVVVGRIGVAIEKRRRAKGFGGSWRAVEVANAERRSNGSAPLDVASGGALATASAA